MSEPEYGLSEADAKAADEAHALSASNHSLPRPESRDGWQSATVGTDGNGPTVDEVTPVFEQFRADALRGPDQDGEAPADEEGAAAAQEKADALAEVGYAAPTGEEAGAFDDPRLKESEAVPAENLNVDEEKEKAKEDDSKAENEGEKKTTRRHPSPRKDAEAKDEESKDENKTEGPKLP